MSHQAVLRSISGRRLPPMPRSQARQDRWLLRQAMAEARADHARFVIEVLSRCGGVDDSIRCVCNLFLFGRMDGPKSR